MASRIAPVCVPYNPSPSHHPGACLLHAQLRRRISKIPRPKISKAAVLLCDARRIAHSEHRPRNHPQTKTPQFVLSFPIHHRYSAAQKLECRIWTTVRTEVERNDSQRCSLFGNYRELDPRLRHIQTEIWARHPRRPGPPSVPRPI